MYIEEKPNQHRRYKMENKKQVLFTGKTEKVETEKKEKRVRRGKVDAVINSITKKFSRVEEKILTKQIEVIRGALTILNDNNKKKKAKITEEDVLNTFTEEQLQAILAKKQGK